ncbi:MAG: DNA polymerase III subunit delta' [Candidatus Limosilactobacillus merdavium]|uniref:DNA polymerase III subunit delta n=1 Tax=Candidatus Limosilactobacillus merdavium TaxID=2838651 RepID=A0A9E2NWE7_9LACO|nr:DNA polymerase III subunit delta' [Candidatus Limosilactobacillus merdavium]
MADQFQAERLQPLVVKQLQTVLKNHELAHAYLFVGPTGSGKSEIAKWLALRLFCLHLQNGEPDLTCPECQRILSGNHPDVVVAKPEGRQIKVDEIRHLKDEFTKSAVEGNRKLFIIHDAEKMTNNAANSLLKFIEEPGPGIYILMLTTNKSAVLPTIRSRTQIIELQPLQRAELEQVLTQNDIPRTERTVAIGLTDSVSEINEWRKDDWLKQAIGAITIWYQHVSKANMLSFVDVQTEIIKLATDRAKQQILLDLIALIWRDTLLIANGITDDQDLHFLQSKDLMVNTANSYSTSSLLTVSQETLTSRHLLDQNMAFQNVTEQLTIKIVQALSA